jgi:superfamily II DNA or RNA helicase
MYARTKKRSELTLRDHLSRLSFRNAVQLLEPLGERLLREGGKFEIDVEEQVSLDDERMRLDLREAVVTIRLADAARQRLAFECSSCSGPCEHIGAAFSLVLEEKMTLGLAAPPPERQPVESLNEEELIRRALEERVERASAERMTIRALDRSTPWTDYTVASAASGKTYRLALRGLERGDSYCSCPDFRKNTLGTCKHILKALTVVKRRFTQAELARPYHERRIAVHLRYGPELELRVLLPQIRDAAVRRLVAPLEDRAITDVHDLLERMRKLEAAGHEVLVYPDAEEYIQQWLFQERMRSRVRAIRANPKSHPLRRSLLKVELLPYQLDGIAFAAGAGRAILADDMGLGKTIQAIGAAELLAREAGISRVLIVCPASLKAQWRAEIGRFCDREVQLILGSTKERAGQYTRDCFFTVCNYEQVLRDILAIEQVRWDLIVLDEGQRIKNWEAQTSRIMKGLRSRFALVLSGTPLENRLDELFSVVEFIDDRRLGPAFRFYNRHRVADEKGKVLGYKNLDELRDRLKPILLRRTRASVMQELPERSTEVVRIAPTDEQVELHRGWARVVSSIANKPFISEMDLLRLRRALLMCRMAADSTFLVDKQPPGYSSKLEKLEELLEALSRESDRKIVLFSEWTTMLDLIEGLTRKLSMTHVRLDGSVPQRKRQSLVSTFQRNGDCKLFLTTNAGATGLNLQAANTVVNVDLPWNPAVLEQRIARAHRMGQKRRVQVFVLITEDTIEESLLATLSAKQELADAALDADSKLDQVVLENKGEDLKRRLEILLGARAEAAVDVSEKRRREAEAERLARQEKVSEAAGRLLSSAFSFLSAMLPEPERSPAPQGVKDLLSSCLGECVREDEKGRPQLTVTLPDRAALEEMARSLGSLLAAGRRGPEMN